MTKICNGLIFYSLTINFILQNDVNNKLYWERNNNGLPKNVFLHCILLKKKLS